MDKQNNEVEVKKITAQHRQKIYGNMARNNKAIDYYQRMLVEGIIQKELSPDDASTMRKRLKRIRDCNKFWVTETYETSQIKVLLKTFLCKDKFCSNCNQVRKLVMKNRFLPRMEQYKDSLYHMVLTVPDCNSENLRETIQHMTHCFKTLVTYLNGNKKVRGVDLLQYEFQGCIRSLEITYKEDAYHPHFHVAAVLGNGCNVEQKSVLNQFSNAGNRLFSDFETIIQRMWWLLINGQRLTASNILGDDDSLGVYSCVIDKFQPEDYMKLFGYVTKVYTEDRHPMSYKNFKTLYSALERIRQIQGYGVFYNMTPELSKEYTEKEYEALGDFLLCGESPVSAYEPLSRLVNESGFTLLRAKNRGLNFKFKSV